MTTDMPDYLVDYYVERQRQRAAAIETFLAGLSPFERVLVHDAAVMGYVRGSMHREGEDIPRDREIIADVVNACFAHPDLYPAVNAKFEEHRVVVEYYTQTQQPDGTWANSSGRTEILEAAENLLAGVRRRVPDAEHRLARRTTSVIVEVKPAEE